MGVLDYFLFGFAKTHNVLLISMLGCLQKVSRWNTFTPKKRDGTKMCSHWPDGRLVDWWHDGSASTAHPHHLAQRAMAPGTGEAVQDGAYPLFQWSSI